MQYRALAFGDRRLLLWNVRALCAARFWCHAGTGRTSLPARPRCGWRAFRLHGRGARLPLPPLRQETGTHAAMAMAIDSQAPQAPSASGRNAMPTDGKVEEDGTTETHRPRG